MKKKITKKISNVSEVIKKDLYFVKIFVGGKVYDASAETISEALDKIKIETFKTKAVLFAEHNDVSKQIILPPVMLRKLVQKNQREFFEKRLLILLR